MNTRIIDGRAGKTCCYVNNQGNEGTPILVLHGGPGFGSDPILTEVLGIKNPMYFYDQYGSKNSDTFSDSSRYTVELFIEQIDDVREEFGLDEIILMGMCWGAGLAVSYSARKNVKGIKALILSSPFLSLELWEKDQQTNLSYLSESDRSTIQRYETERLYSIGYRKSLIPYFQNYYFTRGDVTLISHLVFGHQPEVYRTTWGDSELFCRGSLKDFDLMGVIPNIACPVLLVAGDRDVVRTETMKVYQNRFQDAQLAIIPSSGHMIYNEQLSIVKAVIKSFVKEIDNCPKKNLPSSIRSSL
ncbi:MAG: proline iminopeptidase-family hydrolase [Candidatus Methanoplasma sp.]|jgi:proline-specific peptidase|nr:proline iminopeptidase-family hydrolase [Candidatus Methanoplasma sp.]